MNTPISLGHPYGCLFLSSCLLQRIGHPKAVSNCSILLLLCLGLAHMGFILKLSSIWWQYPAGLALAIPFFILWLRNRNKLGAGDVKLIAATAFYLGLLNYICCLNCRLRYILSLLFLMSVLGSIPYLPCWKVVAYIGMLLYFSRVCCVVVAILLKVLHFCRLLLGFYSAKRVI